MSEGLTEKQIEREGFRLLAYQGKHEKFFQMAQGFKAQDPSRELTSELLELNGHLIKCDFVAVEAKTETIKTKYRNHERFEFIFQFPAVCLAHMRFVRGQLTEALNIIDDYFNHPDFFKVDDLDPVDHLALLRLKAQILLVRHQSDEMDEILELACKINPPMDSVIANYVINCITAINLYSKGHLYRALESAEKAIEIARQSGFSGIFGPTDVRLIQLMCNLEMFQRRSFLENKEVLTELDELTWNKSFQFLFKQALVIDLTIDRRYREALETIQNMRENLNSFAYKSDLEPLISTAELYVRVQLNDKDRLNYLKSRHDDNLDFFGVYSFIEGANQKVIPHPLSLNNHNTLRRGLLENMAMAASNIDRSTVCYEYLQNSLEYSSESGIKLPFFQNEQLMFKIIEGSGLTKNGYWESLANDISRLIQNREVVSTESPYEPLTKKEMEILRFLATGVSIKSIAMMSHISMNTMKTHLKSIYRKLDSNGRDEALRTAREFHLI